MADHNTTYSQDDDDIIDLFDIVETKTSSSQDAQDEAADSDNSVAELFAANAQKLQGLNDNQTDNEVNLLLEDFANTEETDSSNSENGEMVNLMNDFDDFFNENENQASDENTTDLDNSTQQTSTSQDEQENATASVADDLDDFFSSLDSDDSEVEDSNNEEIDLNDLDNLFQETIEAEKEELAPKSEELELDELDMLLNAQIGDEENTSADTAEDEIFESEDANSLDLSLVEAVEDNEDSSEEMPPNNDDLSSFEAELDALANNIQDSPTAENKEVDELEIDELTAENEENEEANAESSSSFEEEFNIQLEQDANEILFEAEMSEDENANTPNFENALDDLPETEETPMSAEELQMSIDNAELDDIFASDEIVEEEAKAETPLEEIAETIEPSFAEENIENFEEAIEETESTAEEIIAEDETVEAREEEKEVAAPIVITGNLQSVFDKIKQNKAAAQEAQPVQEVQEQETQTPEPALAPPAEPLPLSENLPSNEDFEKLRADFDLFSNEVNKMKLALQDNIDDTLVLQAEVEDIKSTLASMPTDQDNPALSSESSKADFSKAEESIHLKIDTFIMDMSDRFDEHARGLATFEGRLSELENLNTEMESNLDIVKSHIEANEKLQERISSLESTLDNLENLVASAAAKVIREELVPLFQEDDEDFEE